MQRLLSFKGKLSASVHRVPTGQQRLFELFICTLIHVILVSNESLLSLLPNNGPRVVLTLERFFKTVIFIFILLYCSVFRHS